MTRIWLLLAGVLGMFLIACGNGGGSARDFIADKYDPSGNEAGAAVFRASDPPAKVVGDITKEEDPPYRVVNAEGTFLRYRDDFVGVLPGGGAGSRVLLADEDEGVAAFYPYVGNEFGEFIMQDGGPGDGGK